jgi:hypothetical protein
MFALALAFGCEGPRGADGIDGMDGTDGTAGTDGTDGVDGTDGSNGNDGTDGTDGSNGNDSLVAVVPESPGENCTYGGQRIDVGLDADADGTLDASEVTSTAYVCDGAPGDTGVSTLVDTSYEPAGSACEFGGVRIDSGRDLDDDGTLAADEVENTRVVCHPAPAFTELAPLPGVDTVWSFALATSDADGSARLGFMFTDPEYRQQLIDSGVLWSMGGVYSGANTYATYEVERAGWEAYEGRTTPQTYAFSELLISEGASYYTTSYPSFGGLISVIRNGQAGVYALSPASTTRKAHSVAALAGDANLYALVAQSGATGLTFSSIPIASFGVTFPNMWVNQATLEASAANVSAPKLLTAGTSMFASYVLDGDVVVRASATPAAIAAATDFPVVGGCTGADFADLAVSGTDVYLACLGADGVITLQRAAVATPTVWTDVPVGLVGAVDALDLEADATGVSLAVRQGDAVRVYDAPEDSEPAFDAVLPGELDLARAADGLVLAVCDRAGDRVLRTFVE